MPVYNWKLPYLLIGLVFGYAIMLVADEGASDLLMLFALPATLFSILWIKQKESFLLAIAIIGITLNIDRSYDLNEEFLLSRWGYMISTTSIALAGLYTLGFFKFCFDSSSRQSLAFLPKFHLIVLFYTLSMILSFIYAYDTHISSYELFYQLQCVLMYLYLVYYIDDESKFNFVIQMLMIGLAFQILIVFLQFATGTQFGLVTEKSHDMHQFTYGRNIEFLRPGGTFNAYNTLADYLTTLLLITLGYLFAQKSLLGRTWVGACLALGIGALMLTHSRGAWLGFGLGATIFFLVGFRRHWITLKAGLAIAVSGVLVLLPFLPRIYFRLTESDEGSGLTRIPLAKLAWNIIEAHPWFGVGMNNYGVVMNNYLTSEIRGEWIHLVHNKYLLIFAEMGVFGIASFLLLIMGMIWLSYQCVQADHAFLAPLALGIIASLVCDGFHMMVDVFQARATVEMFWVLAALAVAASRLRHHGTDRLPRTPWRLASQPLTGLKQASVGQR